MSAPSIIIGGGAGSGKDTVGGMIAERLGGQCIALADPMKRLFGPVFEVDEHTLWGPSSARNEVLTAYSGPFAYEAFNRALERLETQFPDWCLRELGVSHNDVVLDKLRLWARGLAKDHLENQKPFTARTGLQTLGTECGRNLDRNFWVRIARDTKTRLLGGDCFYTRVQGVRQHVGEAPPGFVITTDGRFPNEISEEKGENGLTLLVEPPGGNVLDAATQAAGVKNHASETNLSKVPRHWWDFVLVNNKALGLEALARRVDDVVERLRHQHVFH
jgi:hypothetical protein